MASEAKTRTKTRHGSTVQGGAVDPATMAPAEATGQRDHAEPAADGEGGDAP